MAAKAVVKPKRMLELLQCSEEDFNGLPLIRFMERKLE